MLKISIKLFQSTQHVVIEIMHRLHNRNATIPDQIYHPNLKLAAELPSFHHLKPPVPSKHLN